MVLPGRNTIFQFYSKSKDVKPGFGAGEYLNPSDESTYEELGKIKDWRKILSNFYMDDKSFKLDGYHWNSVEHYYHANKFIRNNPEFYKIFSVESGTDISKDPGMAKAAGGKTGKYKGKQIRPKNIVMDDGFFDNDHAKHVMQQGQFAKYSQLELARKTLLATGDADLYHHVRGIKPIKFEDTMSIREQLRK